MNANFSELSTASEFEITGGTTSNFLNTKLARVPTMALLGTLNQNTDKSVHPNTAQLTSMM